MEVYNNFMQGYHITATLEMDKDRTWYYIHVPKEIRDSLKEFEHRGSIKVTATLGDLTWDCSLLPWADGSAQMSIPKKVREKQELQLDSALNVQIKPRR